MLRNFDSTDKAYGDKESYGVHDSIRKLYGRPHLEEIVACEVANRKGRLLVTSKWPRFRSITVSIDRREAATDGDTQDRVQRLVRKDLDEEVELIHLDFRPRERRRLWSRRLPEVKYEGVA